MGLYSSITNWVDSQTKTNPNAAIIMGENRIMVSMDTNQAGSTMKSRQIQKTLGAKVISLHPVARQLLLRYDVATDLAVGYVSERMGEISKDITYDKYTESILAEAMSYQQPKSKRESAPRFIRPKKKKKSY